jgi:hypothetical protein
MKRTATIVTAVALALAVGLAAQGKTNFSGTWKRDASKSDAPMGRGGAMMGDVTLTIAQTATELTVDRQMGQMSQKAVYKLDGTESTNPGGRGGEVKSKAAWDGAKLVIDSTQTMSMGGNEMTITSKDTWELAADGTLTVTTTRTTPRGEQTMKTVYTKVTS